MVWPGKTRAKKYFTGTRKEKARQVGKKCCKVVPSAAEGKRASKGIGTQPAGCGIVAVDSAWLALEKGKVIKKT